MRKQNRARRKMRMRSILITGALVGLFVAIGLAFAMENIFVFFILGSIIGIGVGTYLSFETTSEINPWSNVFNIFK